MIRPPFPGSVCADAAAATKTQPRSQTARTRIASPPGRAHQRGSSPSRRPGAMPQAAARPTAQPDDNGHSRFDQSASSCRFLREARNRRHVPPQCRHRHGSAAICALPAGLGKWRSDPLARNVDLAPAHLHKEVSCVRCKGGPIEPHCCFSLWRCVLPALPRHVPLRDCIRREPARAQGDRFRTQGSAGPGAPRRCAAARSVCRAAQRSSPAWR